MTFGPRREVIQLREQALRLFERGAARTVVDLILAAQQLAEELLLLVRQAVAQDLAQQARCTLLSCWLTTPRALAVIASL